MKKEFSLLVLIIFSAITLAINLAFLIGFIVVNSLVNSGSLLSTEGLWKFAIAVVAVNLCLVVYTIVYYSLFKRQKS